MIFMVQFKDSWFVFHNSSRSFHKPYFSQKNIYHESFSMNRTQNYGLKTCKQVQNYSSISKFWKLSYQWFPSSSNALSSKSFVNIIFYRAENNKMISKIINHSSIWFTLVLEKHFLKSCNARKFDLFCSIEIYHFEKL